MSRFCPVHPKPLKNKASLLFMFFGKRKSWLDGLFERSYRMKMGHVRLPGMELFMVNQPSLVRQVLIDDAEKFPKHALLGRILKPLLGDSIFTTNGSVWKRQRRMLDPAFAQARLKTVFPLMIAASVAMRNRLNQLGPEAVHDVDVEMTHVTADIIFRTILSSPLEGEDAHAIFNAFLRFQEAAPRIVMPIIYRLPRWMTPWLQRVKGNRAAEEIRSVLEKIIRRRYDAHQRGEPDPHQDILSSLLEAVDVETGKPFEFDELVDQVAMLFLAGHETSASALAWTLYLVSMCPEIQERMHKESVAVLGDRDPEFSDIKQLELTWNVFREALRLYPPVGFFAREATETTKMRDKVMRKGSTIVISPWLIHRHETYWERPNEFDPDRYADDKSRESLQNAYLPFGLGPRVCMGAAFAMYEAALILGVLMRDYRFESLPDHEPQPVGRLTIRSENGVRLKIVRRATAAGARS